MRTPVRTQAGRRRATTGAGGVSCLNVLPIVVPTARRLKAQSSLQRPRLLSPAGRFHHFHAFQGFRRGVGRTQKANLESVERTQRTPPKGYAPVNIGQLLAADKELFVQAAHRLEGQLQGAASGSRPLDRVMKELCVCQEVVQHLLPLVASSEKPDGLPPGKRPHVPGPPFPPEGAALREGKGGGKSKKIKKDRLQIVIPLGCASRDRQNRPNCFQFNLGKCALKVSKGRCAKGYHQCWRVGCNQPHSFTECTMGHQ